MRALIIDTETSGLIINRTIRKAKWPEVIEFAGTTLDWDTGELIDEYSVLIKPSRPLDAKVTEITGITDAMLKDAPHFAKLAAEIKARVERADLIVAHNASFDHEILCMEFERMGMEVKWPRLLCSVEQSISIKGFRMNLSLLHEHLFGMAHEDAHRAATDVRALVRCVVEMRRLEWI